MKLGKIFGLLMALAVVASGCAMNNTIPVAYGQRVLKDGRTLEFVAPLADDGNGGPVIKNLQTWAYDPEVNRSEKVADHVAQGPSWWDRVVSLGGKVIDGGFYAAGQSLLSPAISRITNSLTGGTTFANGGYSSANGASAFGYGVGGNPVSYSGASNTNFLNASTLAIQDQSMTGIMSNNSYTSSGAFSILAK